MEQIPNIIFNTFTQLINYTHTIYTACAMFTFWCAGITVFMVIRFIVLPLSKGKV